MAKPSVDIRPLASADIESVIALARRIWNAYYPAIIGQQQVDYMLDQRYTVARLQEELTRPEICWEVAADSEAEPGSERQRLVGFSSTIFLPEQNELKLDKLYVLPELHGGGVGRALVDRAVARARTLGCSALMLAVNKHNEKAIQAYKRFGFVVRASSTVEIGGGFVMDDFIMARSV